MHLGIQFSLHPASYLFGTQQQLTHTPVRAQLFLLGRCPFFRALHLGIQFSVHPASYLFGTQQQPTHTPVKSSILPLRKILVFPGVVLRHTNFTLSCFIPLRDSVKLTHPPVKSSSFLLWKNHVSQCLLFYNVLILSCLGFPCFGTHPYYSLNRYVHLYYSKRPPPSEIFHSMFGLFLQQKTAAIQNILFYVLSVSIANDDRFAEECNPRLWRN